MILKFQIKAPFIFLHFIIILALISGCRSRSESRSEKEPELRVSEPGWELLFDGKTMKNWEISEFGPQGPVQVSEESIILGMGEGCTGVTWKGEFPRIGYEVKLEAKKISGNDFSCGITFPVADSYCSLIVGGWGGPVVGLSSIDGNDASENETRLLKKFEHGKWYEIHLKVSDEKIEAWIDNEKLVDFNTTGHKLSTRPEVDLSKPFGICSWNTTAALRNIQLNKSLK